MSTNHFFVLALQGDSFCKNVYCHCTKKKKKLLWYEYKSAAIFSVKISGIGTDFLSHLTSLPISVTPSGTTTSFSKGCKLPGLLLGSLKAWAHSLYQFVSGCGNHPPAFQLETNHFWPQEKAQKTHLIEDLWSQLCSLFSFSPLHSQKLFRSCGELAGLLLSSTNSRSERRQQSLAAAKLTRWILITEAAARMQHFPHKKAEQCMYRLLPEDEHNIPARYKPQTISPWRKAQNEAWLPGATLHLSTNAT